uniref:Uncharacterized protein n=1 Tax=Aureoumbra lagunensis TaxID=44058 RepID=A0A7S3NI50_9STRA|mmetsp:Transcript_2189/g.3408  ORF Transcript_2189/g.3408 Transcript_2189/m.3408 type:complete len:239 (+) Transcript_2189:33-749(+)
MMLLLVTSFSLAFGLSVEGGSIMKTTSPVTPVVPNLIANEIDENAMLAASSFPIPPEKLIALCKKVVGEYGIGTKDGGACLSDSFEFCAAVVGPIGKTEYLKALENFDLESAFPDLNPRYYGWRVDCLQPNRVYFMTRTVATHTASLMGKKPTGKFLELPPQLFHMDFDAQGKVQEVGFYVVDRRQGNTGGLGGAFGFLYGVGQPLPIPECRPYKPSFQFRFFSWLANLANKFKKKST